MLFNFGGKLYAHMEQNRKAAICSDIITVKLKFHTIGNYVKMI